MAMVKGKSSRIVVPGANNSEALEAIRMADENGLISGGALIGDAALVKQMAAQAKVDIKKFELIDCKDVQAMCDKAVELIKAGAGDFLVKGLVDSKFYMKSILNKEHGVAEPGALLSHFVLFETANYKKLFAVTDSAITISPTLEQKAKLIQNAVNLMRMLGIEKPNVSVVCPVEKPNEKIPSTLDAVELVKMSQDGRITNATVEGPYDIYISFSRKLADEKGVKGGLVPGDVDILLFPDLDAANPVYKSLAFFAAGLKAATLVVGATVPVILPSRSDAPAVKLYSIALASYLKTQKVTA